MKKLMENGKKPTKSTKSRDRDRAESIGMTRLHVASSRTLIFDPNSCEEQPGPYASKMARSLTTSWLASSG